MAKAKVDWSVLRGSLLTLGVVLVIGGLLVGGGYYFRDTMMKSYKKEQRRFLSISRKYLTVDDEERLIREYLPRFRSMQGQGLVGEERRLDWTESLRRIGLSLRLPSLRYSINPQEPFEPEYPLSTGGYRVYSSRMKLSAGLLHEEDLLRLLSLLSNRAQGSFTVEKCSLQLKDKQIILEPKRTNLTAECELNWLTLQKQKNE